MPSRPWRLHGAAGTRPRVFESQISAVGAAVVTAMRSEIGAHIIVEYEPDFPRCRRWAIDRLPGHVVKVQLFEPEEDD